MKKFISFFYISIILYIGFWFYKNLDYDSVFSNTIDTFKYEFSAENFSNSLQALNRVFSKTDT